MAFKHEEPEEQEAGAPAWMVTFADLMTLLLTFFVLLLSFANMDTQKFRDMLGSLKDAFGTHQEDIGEFADAEAEILAITPNILDMKERERLLFFQEMKKLIDKQKMGKSADLKMEEDGVRLRIRGKALFKTGSADLSSAIFGLLDEMKELLDRFEYKLIVEGHTDNIPMKSNRFPSNWELSSSRAISVIRYFMEKHGVRPAKLSAIGYASTRPIDPKANNSSAENRAKNRRVEFKFEQPVVKQFKKQMTRPKKFIEIDIFERKAMKQGLIKQFQKEFINKAKDMK